MKNNIKIKNCPFCGGESHLWSNHGKHGYFAYVKCSTCSATTRLFSIGETLPENLWDTDTAVIAIEAWNRRCCE